MENSTPDRHSLRPEMKSPGPEPPQRLKTGTKFGLLAEINRSGDRRRRHGGSGVRASGESQTSNGGNNGNNFSDFHNGVIDILFCPKTGLLCREIPTTKALFCGRHVGRRRSFRRSLVTARTRRQGTQCHQYHPDYFHCFHVLICLLSNRSTADPVSPAYREPSPVQA